MPDNAKCPACHRHNAMLLNTYSPVGKHLMRCRDCGYSMLLKPATEVR